MKKITLLVFVCFTYLSFAQQNIYWRSGSNGADSGNWFGDRSCNEIEQDQSQWWYGSFTNNEARDQPNCWDGSFDRHILHIDNDQETSMNVNSNISICQLVFENTITSSRTISDNTITIANTNNNLPKIVNLSAVSQTINSNIKIEYSNCEINPINGDLTFNGDINNNGNSIDVFGNNTLIINGSIIGTGAVYIKNGATLEINNDVVINNLTVDAGGSVTVNAGKSLSISNNLENNGVINLESTSMTYSSLIPNSISGSGAFNYYRHVNVIGTSSGGGNDLISPPVVGQQFGAFASANTNLAASSTLRAFAHFDNTANPGNYVNYDTSVNVNTPIVGGKGYRAATNDGSTLTFAGSVNTLPVNVSITDNVGSLGGWNLIGNPYPSYISFKDFFELLIDIQTGPPVTTGPLTQLDENFSVIYGYNGNASQGWTQWNLAFLELNPDALIAPGQGFFVASKLGGGTVSFTPSMRTTGNSDDFVPNKTSSTSNVAFAKIQLSRSSNQFHTDIYFTDYATRGLDPGYDAGAFGGNATGLFTHLVEDNTGLELAIQALPYNDFNDVTIPLGIKANAGEQIQIGLDASTATIPTSINVYLEDTLEGTFTLLNTSDFVMTPSSTLADAGRFFLRFTSTTLSSTDIDVSSLQIFSNHEAKTVTVIGNLNEDTELSIYDIQGRMVLNQELSIALSSNSTSVGHLVTGVYIVKAQNSSQTKTQKIIIK